MSARNSIILIVALLLICAGCSTNHYRKSADKEVARIIAEKSPYVTNMDPAFTIETTATNSLEGLPRNEEPDESFGPDKDLEVGAHIITLRQALDFAVKHSRTYQARKETVYLTALSLTLARHEYTPIFSGGGSARYIKTRTQIEDDVDGIIEAETDEVRVEGDAGVDILLRTGGRISASFTTDFLRFLTGDPRFATGSRLAATLSQPLLRGAGYKIATENLTQAERDVLYALREFTRYRKEFSVEIASSYYNVLENRDQVRNNWRGYQNFRQNVIRERAFADEGLRPLASLDELKQAELRTESSWINSVRSYRQSLDQFKLLLGLPTDARVVLDDRELEALKILHPNVTAAEAIKVALVSRLDLQTQQDEVEDAERKLKVAANALLPQLDLVANVDMGRQGDNKWLPDLEHYGYNAGVDLDLPFDRKAERNAYRRSLINQASVKRQFQIAIDTVKLQIADGWRALDQAKRTYEISEIGVALAARRVEEQDVRAQLGRGTARELVDAQTALIESKNERTSALVNHTIARLRFWRDMGILMIKESGQWEEITDDLNK